jgi:hypothetical protein
VRGRLPRQRQHQPLGTEDAGVGREQRRHRVHVRLARRHEGAIHQAQPLHTVGLALGLDGFERGDSGLVLRHDDLAAARVRHAEGGTELIEPAVAVDAVPRLERARRVVHAGVNHLAVVGARAHARPRLALEHAHAAATAGDGQCGGEADDAGADDRGIDGFHLISWLVGAAAVRSEALPSQRRLIIE